MVVEPAKIIAIDGRHIWVDVIQKSSCGTCKAKSACGHGIANELSTQSKNICLSVAIDPEDHYDYQIGDRVNVAIHETGLLISAGFMYFFPIVILLLFSALAAQFTMRQPLIACAGFLGMLFGFIGVKYWLADWVNNRFKPVVQGPVFQEHNPHFEPPSTVVRLDP